MPVEITVEDESADGRNYLTWAPRQGTISLAAPDADGAPVDVVLANGDPTTGGQLELGLQRDGARAATLALTLPADGTPVEFFVAGSWPKASSADGDAGLTATRAGSDEVLGSKAVMVRIRKNANALTPPERDRFTTALAKLNDRGTGLFRDFRDMHREQIALDQAHGASGFLPWHRAYLLDLERELQKIDPSVTLPYWRFDQPAPNVFSPEFMGQTALDGGVVRTVFSGTNLLREWKADGASGITRQPAFNQQTGVANTIGQASTLALGGPSAIFDNGQAPAPGSGFDSMEGNPHGRAHTSHSSSSWIYVPATAPKDPMFFLLHCNVDRLWAVWQWFNDRFDGTQPAAFFYRGSASSVGATLIGHNLLDTMWPWNNERGGLRPNNAPRTPFPVVATAPEPGPAPTVGDMLDYQGVLVAGSYMGFGYDDVPFGIAPP